MEEELQALVEVIRNALNGDQEALAQLSESPVDFIDAQTSGVAGDEVDPLQLISEALAGTDLDPATQASVMEAATASMSGYGTPDDGYSSEQLANIFAQGINITVEEGDQIHVDNSLYVDGDVKGGIHQANVTDITEADHGAIVADGAEGSNFQTGEGNTQLNDVDAQNVVSGDNNTVASDYSTIGNENVDAGYIENSEFGKGDQDRSVDLDVKIDDSFTDDDVAHTNYTDDDNVYTDVKVELPEGHGYETPVYEHEDDPHHNDDHHDEEVYD